MPQGRANKQRSTRRGSNFSLNSYVAKCFDAAGQYPSIPRGSISKPQCEVYLYQENNSFNTNTLTEVRTGFSIRLQDFPNYSLWTGAFDEYKIVGCEVWAIPAITQTSAGSAYQAGRYVGSIDLDDASPFSSYAAHCSSDSAMVSGVCTGQYWKFVPRISNTVYNGAVASGYQSADKTEWIDTATPAVNHYGIKFTSTATTVAQNIVLEFRIRVLFRGSRAV